MSVFEFMSDDINDNKWFLYYIKGTIQKVFFFSFHIFGTQEQSLEHGLERPVWLYTLFCYLSLYIYLYTMDIGYLREEIDIQKGLQNYNLCYSDSNTCKQLTH